MKTQYDANNFGTNVIGIVIVPSWGFISLLKSTTSTPIDINPNNYYLINEKLINSPTTTGGNDLKPTINYFSELSQVKHPLARFLGAWRGDDINQMVKLVYKTRSKF